MVIGDAVTDDIMHSFSQSPLTSVVNVLMAFHVFCAFTIVINPVNQDIEEQIGLSHCKLYPINGTIRGDSYYQPSNLQSNRALKYYLSLITSD